MITFEEKNEAVEEMKRVDHMIYVTLKYTRTVDVIRNVLKKLITALDYQTLYLLEHYKAKGKLKEIDSVALVRCKSLEKLFPRDKEIKNMIDFYYKLRKIVNAQYRGREEYRKNVTLVTGEENINIEVLKEYSGKTQTYLNYLTQLME